MSNKLKNQANKLRGAVDKTKAIKAIAAGGIQSESMNSSQAPPPGYDQVNNDDRLISAERDDHLES